MNTMGMMAEENELRILGEAELDGVFGGDMEDLKTAMAIYNVLLDALSAAVNAYGQSLNNLVRKA